MLQKPGPTGEQTLLKIEGSFPFDVPRDIVWKALLEPDIIAKTLPGCEELTPAGENLYKAKLNVKVGPVQGGFEGQFSLSDLKPLEGYRLKLSGKGPTGFLEGEGEIRLEDRGEETTLHYEITAQVGGRVAAVGQRLLDSSARSVARQGLKRFYEQVKRLQQSEDGEVPGEEEIVPSQSDFVSNVAKDVLLDLMPRERRLMILALSLGGLIVFLIILFRVFGS